MTLIGGKSQQLRTGVTYEVNNPVSVDERQALRPHHPPTQGSATGRRMTGHQSLQFMEHLRQARQPKSTDTRGAADPGAPPQPQGDVQRNLPSAPHPKIWEAAGLSAGEFADQAASFYDYERA